MSRPLVSVLVVAHDAARTLPRALASLSAQTMPDWECVVVDDGSRDETRQIFASFRDPRLRGVRSPTNRGRGAARQLALTSARGEIVASLDADDWMFPERLERQLEALERSREVGLVGCAMAVVDARDMLRGIQAPGPVSAPGLARPPMSFATVMLRTSAARRIGFDDRARRAEDVSFLTRLLLEERWARLESPLYVYRPSLPGRDEVLASHQAGASAYAAHRAQYPVRARWLELGCRVRGVAHAIVPAALGRALLEVARRRRLRPATAGERRAFELARGIVDRANGGAVANLPVSAV